MRNLVFEKALHFLAHPALLASLLLLLVNDHLLRRLWPSWLTGKLGDAAWLFFTPFVLAALLAWLIPPLARRKINRELWVFGLAFGLTGAVFSLAKTLPAAHAALLATLSGLLGAPAGLRRDPSDLLALPALLLAWQLYRSYRLRMPAQAGLHPAGLAALPLAALLTIANMSQPDPGIACLSTTGDTLAASSLYQSYNSTDGGLTWTLAGSSFSDCGNELASVGAWQSLALTHSSRGDNLIIRYQSGQPIQQSRDGGQTWQDAYPSPALTDAGRAYLLKIHTGNPYYVPGPLDAFEDPRTGNLLFAMGYEGVLVYTSDGQWLPAAAGQNRPITNFPDLEGLSILVGGEAWLALFTALLVFGILAMRWLRAWPRIVVLVLAVLAWLAIAWAFPPAITTGYGISISALGTLALAVLVIPLAIEITIRLARRQPTVLLPLTGLALAAGLLFLLPFVLWAFNALPGYQWAAAFASLLVVAITAGGFVYFVKQR